MATCLTSSSSILIISRLERLWSPLANFFLQGRFGSNIATSCSLRVVSGGSHCRTPVFDAIFVLFSPVFRQSLFLLLCVYVDSRFCSCRELCAQGVGVMSARGAYGHNPGPALIRPCRLVSPRCSLCALHTCLLGTHPLALISTFDHSASFGQSLSLSFNTKASTRCS